MDRRSSKNLITPKIGKRKRLGRIHGISPTSPTQTKTKEQFSFSKNHKKVFDPNLYPYPEFSEYNKKKKSSKMKLRSLQTKPVFLNRQPKRGGSEIKSKEGRFLPSLSGGKKKKKFKLVKRKPIARKLESDLDSPMKYLKKKKSLRKIGDIDDGDDLDIHYDSDDENGGKVLQNRRAFLNSPNRASPSSIPKSLERKRKDVSFKYFRRKKKVKSKFSRAVGETNPRGRIIKGPNNEGGRGLPRAHQQHRGGLNVSSISQNMENYKSEDDEGSDNENLQSDDNNVNKEVLQKYLTNVLHENESIKMKHEKMEKKMIKAQLALKRQRREMASMKKKLRVLADNNKELNKSFVEKSAYDVLLEKLRFYEEKDFSQKKKKKKKISHHESDEIDTESESGFLSGNDSSGNDSALVNNILSKIKDMSSEDNSVDGINVSFNELSQYVTVTMRVFNEIRSSMEMKINNGVKQMDKEYLKEILKKNECLL